MNCEATFVLSAAGPADFPRDGAPEVAFVGRSNVGKSSLMNALVRQRVARTSRTPGKTRFANVYRVRRGARAALYLVDLPGYGYARGGSESARAFDELTQAYFTRDRQAGRVGQARQVGHASASPPATPALLAHPALVSALFLVDARHPGLGSDLKAWHWLREVVGGHAAIVATKIDKLSRGERIRAIRQLESVWLDSVLPVSAVTGEGLDALWTLIDNLASNRNQSPRRNRADMALRRPPNERLKNPLKSLPKK